MTPLEELLGWHLGTLFFFFFHAWPSVLVLVRNDRGLGEGVGVVADNAGGWGGFCMSPFSPEFNGAEKSLQFSNTAPRFRSAFNRFPHK